MPGASSPVETRGGIDFTTMNVLIQPMGSFSGLDFSLPVVKDIENFNIAEGLLQLKRMIAGGIDPSGDRIKELAAVCYQKGKLSEYSQDLLVCIMDACKLEEMQAGESSAQLKEALVILDVNRFVAPKAMAKR